MRRGGLVFVQVATLLHGDGWPDLSNAALGAWVRLKAASELTGEPVGDRQCERLEVTPDLMAELQAAGLIDRSDGHCLAIGMPEPARYPSDDPAAVAARVRKHRATQNSAHPQATQIRSTQLNSESNEVTTRNDVTEDDDDRAYEAYQRGPVVCAKCRGVILGGVLRTGAGPYHAGGCPVEVAS